MHFVYPWFFWALAVLAIPVIIHLFKFRKAKTVLFPNLRFLQKVQLEEKSHEKLKHIIVLSLRLLAFASLVLAFTVPFFGDKRNGASDKNVVGIYLDNSLSMGARNQNGFVLEEAKNKARELVKSFSGNTTFVFMNNSDGGQLSEPIQASEVIKRIDETKVSARSMDIDQVKYKLEQTLLDAEGQEKSLYLISDLQKSFVVNNPALPHRKGVQLLVVPVQSGATENISLDSAWLGNPFAIPGEKNSIYFSVSNFTGSDVENYPVKLFIQDNLAGNAMLNIKSKESAISEINFTTPNTKTTKAKLVIDDEQSAFDNTLFFTLHPPAKQEILAMSGAGNTYLDLAAKTSGFITVTTGLEENTNKPNSYFYGNFSALTSKQAEEIRNTASEGSRVVLVPGVQAGEHCFDALQSSIGFPKITKLSNQKSKIKREALQNPFFKQVFIKIPQLLEMPSVFQSMQTGGNAGNGEMILTTEEGEPVLLGFNVGKGKVFVFTTAWENKANNFVQSTLFYPVFANIFLNAESQVKLFETTAGLGSIAIPGKWEIAENNLELISESGKFVPEVAGANGNLQLFIGAHLDKAGFYTLQDKTRAENQETIALNFPRSESNPGTAEKDLLASWLEKNDANILNESNTGLGAKVQESLKKYWKIFIWIAAISLLLEILVLTFWSKYIPKYFNKPSTG